MASKDSTTEYKFLPLTPQMKDLTGQKFGRLLALGVVGMGNNNKSPVWLCECECDALIKVAKKDLGTGNTKSCGCLRREITKARFTTHGMSKSETYKSWASMNYRCYNKNATGYKHYGGRGLTVCPRWRKSFENFYVDMGQCPNGYSLERKNNDKGYSPSNCKWSDRFEQANNRRSNRVLTHNGISLTAAQWAEKIGIDQDTLMARINYLGWSIDKALTIPVKEMHRKTNRVFVYDGVSLTVRQWAERADISLGTLRSRLYEYGWSINKALTTPIRRRKT